MTLHEDPETDGLYFELAHFNATSHPLKRYVCRVLMCTSR